ncbi:MAG: L,D-transpeptidase [Hyphomicrobiaceae bacterium]|nr:L,D-transpeptidase [Hyphomicrobiaceae bacterium]
MFKRVLVLCAALAMFAMPFKAFASIRVNVDISTQRMEVYVDGELRHTWRVSTGRGRYRTPTGSYRPTRLERRWFSRKYNSAPMPYAIFFRGGYAIHGSYQTRRLGRPASHGCVRLSTGNAARLFRLVRQYGPSSTRIDISY